MASPGNSTIFSDGDVEIRFTPADVEALERAQRHRPLTNDEYLLFLGQFHASGEQLRLKAGPRGERFRL